MQHPVPPPTRHTRRSARFVSLALAAALVLAASACGGAAGDVLSAAAPVVGDPGNVLDAFDLEPAAGARIKRLRYITNDESGDRIAVTGLLAVPDRAAPPGGWPLMVWAHGTIGTADRCAPSIIGSDAVVDLQAYLDAGWAIAMPDYEGIGTDSPHPYLQPRSAAFAVLDSARAARNAADSGVSGDSPVALVGHSQGGHAALAAAQEAADYAPELRIVGVVAGAPVTDVGLFADHLSRVEDLRSLLMAIGRGTMLSNPDLDAGALFVPEIASNLADIDEWCLTEGPAESLRGVWPVTRMLPTEGLTWGPALAAAGVGTQVEIPALALHGTADTLVPIEGTEAWVGAACAAGATVEYRRVDGANHNLEIDGDIIAWIGARLDPATPPANTC